jgi:hypothetical protein
MSTETVVSALMHGWISRFGIPSTLISDRGKQFESKVWNLLMKELGITRKRTTAYHPSCNGAIERWHRTLKNALRAKLRRNPTWTDALPMVLLGIRSSINRQGHSPAKLLYGESVELPHQFFVPTKNSETALSDTFLHKFFDGVKDFPVPNRQHEQAHYVPKELKNATHVWLKDVAPSNSLSSRYVGPYKVLSRTDKTVTVERKGRPDKLSIDRVKPAFLQADVEQNESVAAPNSTMPPEPVAEIETTVEPVAKLETIPQPENIRKSSIRNAKPQEQTKPENSAHEKPNTVVYAKSWGYPPWPAKIIDPKLSPLENCRRPISSIAIQFFGTNRYAYVKCSAITPYVSKQTRHKGLQNAITLANEYLTKFAKQEPKNAPKVDFNLIYCLPSVKRLV